MVHGAAAQGFGSNADGYAAARPAYHPALIDRFVERYGAGAIVDIGAGTGIFTAQLTACGVAVTAVEPVATMRTRLAAEQPGLDVRDGTAERLPALDHSFDTAVAAQAFHWFDHGAALDELARVLRPGGHLVTVWNVKHGDTAWLARYLEIVDRYQADTPRHADGRWRAAVDADLRYELVDDWWIANPRSTDREGVVGRALSTSFIAALAPPEREAVATELRLALREEPDQLEFPYRSELQAWRLTS